MSDATTYKFEVPVVKEKPSESSCVEFNLHSCYYNDFFLLRTPITINGRPAEIKLAESGPDKGSPYLCDEKLGVKLTLSNASKIVEYILSKHGVYHIDTFYYDKVPMFSVQFRSLLQLKDFLSHMEELRSELASEIGDAMRCQSVSDPSKAIHSQVNASVEAQLFLTSPARGCEGEQTPPAKVYRVSLATVSHHVNRWQESKLFDFKPDLFSQQTDDISNQPCQTDSQSVSGDQSDLQFTEKGHQAVMAPCAEDELSARAHEVTTQPTLNIQSLTMIKWKDDKGMIQRLRIVMVISSKWQTAGRLLGIPDGEIEAISMKHQNDPELCCSAILTKWLNNGSSSYSLTWDGLTELLKDIELTQVALNLKEALSHAGYSEPEHEISMCKQELKRAKLSRETLRVNIDTEISTVLVCYEGQIKMLNSEVKDLKKQLTLRNEEIKVVQEAKSTLRKDCCYVLDRITEETNGKIKALKESLDAKESELKTVKRKLTDNVNEINAMMKELDAKSAEVCHLQEEVYRLKELVDKKEEKDVVESGVLKEELERKDSEINQLSVTIEKYENEIDALQQKLQAQQTLAAKDEPNVEEALQLLSLMNSVVKLKLLQSKWGEKSPQELQRAYLQQTPIRDSKCTVTMESNVVDKNKVAHIHVHVMDKHGAPCCGNQAVDLELTSQSDNSEAGMMTEVTREAPGEYTVAFIPIKAGTCEILVKIDGTPLPAGPLKIDVQNYPDVHNCKLEVAASKVNVNTESTFQVYLFDEDGDPCYGDENIDIKLTTPSSLRSDKSVAGKVSKVTKDKPGVYTVQYIPIKTGPCEILVKIVNETQSCLKPYRIQVIRDQEHEHFDIKETYHVKKLDQRLPLVAESSTQPVFPTYIGLYDFTSPADVVDGLSFNKGDHLCVLWAEDKDWWLARYKSKSSKKGYIPSSYVAEWTKKKSVSLDKGSKSPPCLPTRRMYPLYVSKYDYDSRTSNDLGLHKGDVLFIIDSNKAGWWFARSIDTGKEGYVPSNYLAKWKSLEAEEWFFGKMKRVDADKLLMMPFNQFGSYLIRESETTSGDYCLCIRDRERVRHYRIKQLVDGTYFITRRVTFENLQDLVVYYQQQSDGLCTNLIYPCLLAEKPQTAGLSQQANEEWEIDHRTIQLVKKLGAGHFGEVWEGLWNGTTAVAVKTLKPGTMSATKFLQEAAIMKKLRHPKLIQLYAVCTQEEPIYIVTELMKHGSMLKYLQGDGRSLKLPQLIDMSSQIAAGMAYLQEQNYIHRNLAARTILVGDNLICKVANFEIAHAQVNNEDICEGPTLFPIKWIAPEAAMYNRFSNKSDVWSFGIVLYEIITYGRLPYPGMTNAEVLESIQQGYRMPRPMGCPDKLYDIMLECWREEPSSRSSFDILQWQLEEFFTGEESGGYRDPTNH